LGAAIPRANSTPLKQIVASGLGYGLLPFSGIHRELAAIGGAVALDAR
jgi:LysR family nitrogen assimilation transcriptional regulator